MGCPAIWSDVGGDDTDEDVEIKVDGCDSKEDDAVLLLQLTVMLVTVLTVTLLTVTVLMVTVLMTVLMVPVLGSIHM